MPTDNITEETVSFDVEVTTPSGESKIVKIVTVIPETGRGKGNPKLMPQDYSTWDLDTVVELWGKEKAFRALVKPRLNQILANFTAEATTRSTVVDGKTVFETETDRGVIAKDYSEMFQVLSQRGETIQALSRRLNEIEQDELPKIVEEIFSDTITPERQAELKPLAKQLNEERAELKKSIAEKKSKKTEEKEGEDSTEASDTVKAA